MLKSFVNFVFRVQNL